MRSASVKQLHEIIRVKFPTFILKQVSVLFLIKGHTIMTQSLEEVVVVANI